MKRDIIFVRTAERRQILVTTELKDTLALVANHPTLFTSKTMGGHGASLASAAELTSVLKL